MSGNDLTPQTPINSGFGFESTAEDVIKGIDLTGKIAIVTGGYVGLGLETTRVLASAGATVIVPARDLGKAKKLVVDIPRVEFETLDLIDPASIDAFANRFIESKRPLHFLINNAGIMMNPLTRDSRGYESQFSTNHLGHFQLTARLWPALVQAKHARVVNVSSFGHTYSPVVFEDPNYERREYERAIGYGQSKTANILFSLALDQRGKSHGVRAFSLHPGAIIDTDLSRHVDAKFMKDQWGIEVDENRKVTVNAFGFRFKTVGQGAATTVWCATNPKLENLGGVYCEDCEVTSVSEGEKAFGKVMPYAIDLDNANALWTLSEKLTNVKFSI